MLARGARPLLVLAALVACAAPAAHAIDGQGVGLGPVTIAPTLGAQIGYDDNVTLSAEDPIDDIVARGLVRLDFLYPRRPMQHVRPAPSQDLLLLTPTDVLPLVERYVLFPGDIERFVDAPPQVRREDVRHREALLVDLSYQLDGVFFLTEDDIEDTPEQIIAGGGTYAFPGGLIIGAGGEWIDRTTSSSDIFDVAQFASDIRFAGADFDRGAAGAIAEYAFSPMNRAEVGYAFFGTQIGEQPFDLFDFHLHTGSVGWRHERPSGVVVRLKAEIGRIDGEATADALRAAGLVEPFVPLEFEGDPRAADYYQGWAEVAWPIGPRFTAVGRLGAQARSFDERTFDDFVDVVAEGKLVYRFGVGSELRLRYIHEPIDVFGEDGAFLVRDQGQLAASLRLGRWWRVNASVDGGIDRFDQESSLTLREREDTFFGGLLGLEWNPTPWLAVQADYSGRVRSSDVSEEDTTRNRFRLRTLFRY